MGKATLLTNNDVLTLATLRAAQLVFMARRFYEHIEEHWFVGTIVGSNKWRRECVLVMHRGGRIHAQNAQTRSMSALRALVLLVLCLCLVPAGHGKRIVSYGNSHNDTRILWEQTLRLDAPFQGDLFYWWGDDEPFPAEYDLMTIESGVPVSGEDSGYPLRGAAVQSCMAVSDGPLPVVLPEAQAAAAAGKWSPSAGKINVQDSEMLEEAQAVRRRYEKTQLRAGSRRLASVGAKGKPAIVYITLTSASEEEASFPAFAQEMLGDVVARGAKRLAGAIELKLMLEDGRAVGLPESLGGVPLEMTLAQLGHKDGSELHITGVSAYESAWPQYEGIKLPLEAFLADQPWPPCENFGLEDPLNHFPVGASLQTAVGPEEDNSAPNMVVLIASPESRVCINKHALSYHLASHSTEPGLLPPPSPVCPWTCSGSHFWKKETLLKKGISKKSLFPKRIQIVY